MTQPLSVKERNGDRPVLRRRYLAVHLPWLPAQSALIRKTAPPDAPFVLIEKQRGALRIMALCPDAVVLGLSPGMSLADARARSPGLVAVAEDREADGSLLHRLTEQCRAYSPSVASDPPQGILLDIAGCTHFFAGGEAELRDDLIARLAGEGLTARAACADTPDAARALARFGGTEVRGLPVQALGVGADVHLALRRSGFRRIGDLADLPRGPLAARFGTALPVLLARLLEEENPHIAPMTAAEPVADMLRFAEPIGRADDVLDAVETLLMDIGRVLEERGEGGRAFALSLHRSDGHVARLLVETGAPTRDPALVLRLLRERIESLADPLDPGFGYDSIGLAVPLTEALRLRQSGLDDKEKVQGALGGLLDRLAVRYGAESVLRFVPGNSHVPERAAYLAVGRQGGEWPVQDAPPRPFSLFEPPQWVEVLAALPDEPPRRFRWRGRWHDVVRQEGPERIAPEWWRRRGGHGDNPGVTRDYYRVEDADGRRFWLFRHGLYGQGPERPGWYLHGLFA